MSNALAIYEACQKTTVQMRMFTGEEREKLNELWEGHCEDEAVQNVAAVCKRLVEKADQLREVAALLEDKA